MIDTANLYAKVFSELGLVAGMIVILLAVVIVAFWFTLWRLHPLQKDIKADQATIAECNKQTAQTLKEVSLILASHDQRAQDMHATCKDHGGQIDYLHSGMVEFKGDVVETFNEFKQQVSDRLAKVEQEVAVLQKAVDQK